MTMPQADPSRRVRRDERGSVLILVLGILALLVVLAVVYGAIGQADRRQSGSITKERRVTQQAELIGDYIAGVIGDDVFSTSVQRTSVDEGDALLIIEGTDYPSTDVLVRTQENDPALRFNPRGSYSTTLNGNPAFDFRRTSDPWLASTRPTYIGVGFGAGGPTGVDDYYLHARDWLKISNVAADGRYVNLVNLRNNYGAESGFGNGEMSSRLTLFGGTGLPQNANSAFTTPQGLQADLNRPYDWDSYQRHLFRPVADRDYRLTANFAQAEHPDNQYADADGDGMYDSRWSELVDVSIPGLPRFYIENVTDLRIFYAARVIDLSSLANVNVGTDTLSSGPTNFGFGGSDTTRRFRFGMTPSAIDVRRLLSFSDAYEDLEEAYDGIDQFGAGFASDYNAFDEEAALAVASRAYLGLRHALRVGTPPPTDFDFDEVVELELPGVRTQLSRAERAAYFNDIGADPGGRDLRFGRKTFGATGFGVQDEIELLTYFGINDPDRFSSLEAALAWKGADANDDVDIRTFHPLRSNRNLLAERGARRNGSYTAGYVPDTADDEAMLLAWIDPRATLTTLSASRPLRSAIMRTHITGSGENDEDGDGRPDDLTRITDPQNRDPNDDFVASAKVKTRIERALLEATRKPYEQGETTDEYFERRRRAEYEIFHAYLEALAPYYFEDDVWTNEDKHTLFYGGAGPELAIRIAAQMTANLIDSFDLENGQDAFPTTGDDFLEEIPTVVRLYMTNTDEADLDDDLNQTQRRIVRHLHPGNANADNAYDPSDGDRYFESAFLDDLTPGPSSGDADGPEADSIWMFGFEPQAFISGAALYHFAWDSPAQGGGVPPGDGGDDEWEFLGLEPCDDPSDFDPGIVTIDLSIPAGGDTNPDFLGQVFAVQVVNPFDHPIDLRDHFVVFGGQRFDVPDSGGADPSDTILRRHEAAVLYATNPGNRSTFDELFPSETEFNEWRDTQFANQRRIELVRKTTLNGTSDAPDDVVFDFLVGAAGDNAQENRVVYLWRELNAPTGLGGGGDSFYQLVDRLNDRAGPGSRPTLDRRPTALDFPLNQIEGTESIPREGESAPCDFEGDLVRDNSGFTMALVASIRRPDEPGGSNVPRGAFPSFCLENRRQIGGGSSFSMNNTVPAVSAWQRPERDDFVDPIGGSEGDTDPEDGIITHVTIERFRSQATSTAFLRGLRESPFSIDQADREAILDSDHPDSISFDDLRLELNVGNRRGVWHDDEDSGQGWDLDAPEPRQTWTLRVTDALLPLAVGGTSIVDPRLRPGDVGDLNSYFADEDRLEEDWTTPAEAIAFALGYGDEKASSDPHLTGQGVVRPYDRARLDLFAPAPFVDLDGNAQFDADQDLRRYPGIPHAMSVLDRFRSLAYTVPQRGELLAGDENEDEYSFTPASALGATSRPVAGLININTASIQVLRALPMFSEDENPGSWWNGQAGPSFDPAWSVVTYRDRVQGFLRDSGVVIDEFIDQNPLDFFEDDERAEETGIDALRKETGFQSVGELMAVRFDPEVYGGGTPQTLFSIDRLARNNSNSSFNGLEPLLYRSSAGVNEPLSRDAVTDSYDEQLQVVAAAMNSVTVRSDVFAAWIVVRGYAREDVEGLADEAPMVPTLERRYLMIIDRSNVTREGDRPRILAFEELPVDRR